MAELSTVKSAEIIYNVVHPATDEVIGVIVTLISINDERMKKIKRQIIDRRMKLEARGKHMSAEDVEENGNNLTFSAMTGWSWEKDADGDAALFHGKKPEFTRENVMQVFNELPWFKDQLDAKISETKDFFVK